MAEVVADGYKLIASHNSTNNAFLWVIMGNNSNEPVYVCFLRAPTETVVKDVCREIN